VARRSVAQGDGATRPPRRVRGARAPVSEAEVADLLVELAGKSERARLMSEVEGFRAIPTSMTSFNRATKVGGAPLSCVWLVHGPSGGGKTALICELLNATRRARGLGTYVDAELAADTRKWFRRLGVDAKGCLYIGRTGDKAKKPTPLTYEETVSEVDGVLDRFQEGKAKGRIPAQTPLFIAIDSISKLVPEKLLKEITKEGGEALRSGVGRLQAMMNTAWLLGLGPRIGDDNIIFLVIAHEGQPKQVHGGGETYDIRGGNALVYDAMVQVRVTFSGLVRDLSDEGAPPTGKRHRAQVLKNKHGISFDSATFYTSNGKGLAPVGFDRPREILTEALVRKFIEGPSAERGAPKMTSGTRFEFRSGASFKLSDFYDASKEAAREALDDLAGSLDADLFREEED